MKSAGYNALGKVNSILLGNNQTTSYQYWGIEYGAGSTTYYGRLRSIATGGAQVQTLTYNTYDAVGNVTQLTDTRNNYPGGETINFAYDQLDRLISASSGLFNEGYGYSNIGCLTSKGGVSYSYPNPQNPRPHAPTAVGVNGYGYDANGNLISGGNWTYAYDKENRMVKAVQSGDVKAKYAYDGDGKRVKRLDTNGTIHYIGSHYERNVGNGADTTEKITKYYYATLGKVTKLIAFRKNGTLYYVLSDHLGSTVAIKDQDGNPVDPLAYTVYGETRSGGANTPTDRRFTSQILGQSAELYWYSSRPYNPVLARFTQPDAVTPDCKKPQALNRYQYCLNNPLKYVDLTGRRPTLDEGGGGSGELPTEPPGPIEPPTPEPWPPPIPSAQPSIDINLNYINGVPDDEINTGLATAVLLSDAAQTLLYGSVALLSDLSSLVTGGAWRRRRRSSIPRAVVGIHARQLL